MVHVAGVFPLFSVHPLIPHKFLECLHPRKPALGRAEAARGLWSRGWGPSPASPPHRQQLAHARSLAASGGCRLSSPPRGRRRAVGT